MAQPAKASDTNPEDQDTKKRPNESADQTGASVIPVTDKSTAKLDTTAVATQVTNDKGVPVGADSIPTNADQNSDPASDGNNATDPEPSSSTDEGSDIGDQTGASNSGDDSSDVSQQDEGDDNDSSANNGVPPPDLSDPQGLELSINEIPNFDVYCTRCELLDAIDKAISKATESSNSRELLILKRIKTYYFNVLSIKSICSLILNLQLGVELPVTLRKITQGVHK